jgi:hypothetical protein
MTEENRSKTDEGAVPSALRVWFVIHFAIDMTVAVPIFLAPGEVLGLLGWVEIDPLATRLAAAALFGIGLESLFGRNAGRESFRGMLQLKLIWSAFAAMGLAWSVLETNLRYPLIGWLLVGTFAAFHVLWWYWILRLKRSSSA